VLGAKRAERRGEVRVRLRVPLKLKGQDVNGKAFQEETITENVAPSSFLCGCTATLAKDSIVQVYFKRGGEQLIGSARVIRLEATETPYPRYAFHFVEKTGAWVLQ
jgi:hypothetical protein